MEEQGKIVDYVIIMAYDEHYNGSCAGSVASISYVKQGISTALSMVPADKLVNGIPFYVRICKETQIQYADDNAEIRNDGQSEYDPYALSYENASMQQAQDLLKKYNVEAEWLNDIKQYYAEVPLEHGKYRIWLEDATSLEEKMKLVQKNNLAGVACWKIGLETDDVWEVITEYLNQ
jgi:spore germination protein YaaH